MMRLFRSALHALGFCAILSVAAIADDGTRPGFWAILTRANVWLASQVISTNATQTTDPTGGTPLLAMIGADSVSPQSRVFAYQSTPVMAMYRYNGTAAAPAGIGTGASLGGFFVYGYATAGLGPANGMQCLSAEAFTGASARGVRCQLLITPIGTATNATAINAGSDGIAMAYPVRYTFADTLTAAGTTQATALALASDINYVTTTASGSGAILSAYNSTLGGVQRQEVFNEGANALLVYPPSGASIKAGTATGAANASISLASGGHGTFTCVSATLCRQGP